MTIVLSEVTALGMQNAIAAARRRTERRDRVARLGWCDDYTRPDVPHYWKAQA